MSKNKKFNIILDLDQTLISAEANEDYDFEKHRTKAKKFDFEDMDGYYIVFLRPSLQRFLDFLFKHFNVSVWTAASKDYALFIIDKIINTKKDRKLDYIFYSYHCDISRRKTDKTKNLSLLWDFYKLKGYNKNNTIIIDDYDEVYNTQPNNCINIIPFEFLDKGSENDKVLKDLQKYLKKLTSKNKDDLLRKINENILISHASESSSKSTKKKSKKKNK